MDPVFRTGPRQLALKPRPLIRGVYLLLWGLVLGLGVWRIWTALHLAAWLAPLVAGLARQRVLLLNGDL